MRHHYNLICGHTKTNHLFKQRRRYHNKGINEYGWQVIKELLSLRIDQSEGAQVLIDTKLKGTSENPFTGSSKFRSKILNGSFRFILRYSSVT